MSEIISNITNGKTNEFLISQMQGFNLTQSLINQELTGIFNSETLRDMNNILGMYKIYKEGAEFLLDPVKDYVPSKWRSMIIKELIDKEARFMFSIPPDINFSDPGESTKASDPVSAAHRLVKKVLTKSKFNSKLVKAAKDCLIGKRIAIATNFGDKSITVSFIPSLEFVYETDPTNVDIITKFIQFYNTVVNTDKNQQRIYKKKWWMEKDGFCWVSEEMYDGNAVLVDTITAAQKTALTWIPVEIIINEGLSGDPFGNSDIESLNDTESEYNRLSSKDHDSLRKGADQITWARDMDPKSTKGLSRAPGAFWDLQSDPVSEEKTGEVGVLNASMEYSSALETTLSRLRANMFGKLDVPDTSREALQSILTNGKTMKALYWGLMTRCNEKMLVWIPAIEQTLTTIIEGGRLYPELVKKYVDEAIAEDYDIVVENCYPILEDEVEEKTSDLAEVNAKTMSRKAYMKKHRNLTNDDVDEEIDQITLEMQLLEQDSFGSTFGAASTTEPQVDENGDPIQTDQTAV